MGLFSTAPKVPSVGIFALSCVYSCQSKMASSSFHKWPTSSSTSIWVTTTTTRNYTAMGSDPAKKKTLRKTAVHSIAEEAVESSHAMGIATT